MSVFAVNYVAAIAGSLKRVDEALEEIENRRDPQLISIPEYLRTIKKHVSFEIAKNISKRAIALSIESAKPMGLEEDIKFGTVRTYNTEILEAAYVDVIHKPQI